MQELSRCKRRETSHNDDALPVAMQKAASQNLIANMCEIVRLEFLLLKLAP